MRRDIFQAIADPTRREIIHLISQQSLTLNAVAENFHVSRPAISKHVKILTECGVITIRQQGRERYCQPNMDSLREVSDWIEPFQIFWTSKLQSLDSFLSKNSSSNKKSKPSKKSSK